MPDVPGPDFNVVFSTQNRERLRAWAKEAIRLGQGGQFLESLGRLIHNLAATPQTWGDPLYRLKHLGLVMYHRVFEFFYVSYAVDEQRRIVYVKEIKVQPDAPFG